MVNKKHCDICDKVITKTIRIRHPLRQESYGIKIEASKDICKECIKRCICEEHY